MWAFSCVEEFEKIERDFIHYSYPQEIRERIGNLIKRVLSDAEGQVDLKDHDQLYRDFFRSVERDKKLRKDMQLLYPEFKNKASKNWPKENWAYLYPDKTNVRIGQKVSTFKDIEGSLDYYMEKLKIKNFYFTPFLESPRKDGGYDVKHYLKVAEDLGGNQEFLDFVRAVRKRGGQVIIDFVPGHVSVEHSWFKKALMGLKKYLDRFLHTQFPPKGKFWKSESGDSYIRYRTENGKEYDWLLLFPDSQQEHWFKENVKTENGYEQRYFRSSFYSHQKNLNLQNPDVLREHFKTIGYWMSRGVTGIRADALPWWILPKGVSEEYTDQSKALSALFHEYIKMIDSEAILLPEIVSGIEVTIGAFGNSEKVGGKTTGQNATAVFNFEKSVEILHAAATGDFESIHNHILRNRLLNRPENVFEVFYLGNHHDEIYTGLIRDPDLKSKFVNLIKEKGGLIYKGGNSAGIMAIELFGGDAKKYKAFIKYALSFHGAPAFYQGIELGLRSAWEHAYLETKRQLPQDDPNQKILDEILSDPIKRNQKPDLNSNLWGIIDGRLLHRNQVKESRIEKAMKGEDPLFNAIAKLADLRSESEALKEGGLEEPVDTLRRDVSSFMRRSKSENILVVKNGNNERAIINLRLDQITKKSKFSLKEIESEVNFEYKISSDNTYITIEIPPNETLWLQVIE